MEGGLSQPQCNQNKIKTTIKTTWSGRRISLHVVDVIVAKRDVSLAFARARAVTYCWLPGCYAICNMLPSEDLDSDRAPATSAGTRAAPGHAGRRWRTRCGCRRGRGSPRGRAASACPRARSACPRARSRRPPPRATSLEVDAEAGRRNLPARARPPCTLAVRKPDPGVGRRRPQPGRHGQPVADLGVQPPVGHERPARRERPRVRRRPQAFGTAGLRADGGRHRQRQPAARGVRLDAQRPARTPFAERAVSIASRPRPRTSAVTPDRA